MSDAAPLRSAAPLHQRYLLWLAGFLDGRGYIGIVFANNSYIMRLKVVDKDENLLREIHAFTGYGSVNAEGKTFGWTVSGPAVQTILRRVQPHMRARRAHADALLEFPVLPRGEDILPQIERKRREIYERLRELNKQG